MALSGKPAVLVVDDNPQARAVAVDMFQSLGLIVFDAYRGEDALRILAEHPSIRVLFADMRMPWMMGDELARQARRIRPDLKIVLTSGYEDHAPDADIFLPKPVRLNQLAAILKDEAA